MTPLLRPLGVVLLAFLAGLLLSLRLAPPAPPLVLGAAALAGWYIRSVRRGRMPARTAGRSAALLYLAAGAAAGATAARQALEDCRARIPDGAGVVAEGVLGAGVAADLGAPSARLPIVPLVHARVTAPGAGPCAGELRVRLDPGTPPARAGTRVRIAGEWVRPGNPVVSSPWPRDPRLAGYLAADTVAAAGRPSLLRNPLLTMRGLTESALRELFPRHGPIAEALLLGRRERLDPALTDRFARAGLVHLLAISGSHVGLLAAILIVVGGAARLPRARVAWLCIACIALYLAVIGAPASAVRAGIMLSLALLAVVLQRPAAAVPMMAAAALVILAVWPRAVLSPGFQLSFSGVIGILIGRRLLLDPLPRALRRGRVTRPVVESLAISASAFAATAPIAAHHFGQIAPIGILANLVAMPATALALSGIVGAAALHPLVPPLAAIVADGAGAALDLLDRTAAIAAAAPLGHAPVPRPDWAAWIASGAAASVAWSHAKAARRRVRMVVAAGAALALIAAWPVFARAGPGALEIHFIDVGQGDAIALRTPADRWILIDTGPRSPTYDAGARRVVPFLHAHRVRRLEALILTHPDLDHMGGAASVLRALPVRTVIEPGFPVGKEMYAEILALVEERRILWRAARAGQRMALDGIELSFLWPEPDFLDLSRDANDISAVVLVRFGDFEALLTGDAPAEVERRLVERYGGAIRAEVLKAGHHGSATSTSLALLRAVEPELVVIPVGRKNRYGHPAGDVLGRINSGGIPIARTDRDGTITLRIAANGGGRWTRIER